LDTIPVYIRSYSFNVGSGHAWVVDGAQDTFMEERYYEAKTLKEICLTWSSHYKYLSFNWGYGGANDGYYMAYSKTYNRESGWREKEYDFYLRNGACFSSGKRFIVDLYPPK
ncbi:MAG: C10 family peptidase, partial [Duncaniella sp.]|nr:C10 family peptidase [Duncaniella sp.]